MRNLTFLSYKNQTMIISIACDHAGFPYKETIKKMLQSKGHEVLDFGTHSNDSVDYPDFAHTASAVVEQGLADLGVVMCGSGNGVCMTANKHADVRAALCWNKEVAELARLHNNANVIGVPVRFISENEAVEMVDAFISTSFEGGRHARRVNKINFI